MPVKSNTDVKRKRDEHGNIAQICCSGKINILIPDNYFFFVLCSITLLKLF